MPEMITGKALLTAVEEESFIRGGVSCCAEAIKYSFRRSNHILKAKFRHPICACELSHAERAELIIEPDEVVFVLS